MYFVFTCMSDESYRRQFRSLLLCSCDVCQVLMHSLYLLVLLNLFLHITSELLHVTSLSWNLVACWTEWEAFIPIVQICCVHTTLSAFWFDCIIILLLILLLWALIYCSYFVMKWVRILEIILTHCILLLSLCCV